MLIRIKHSEGVATQSGWPHMTICLAKLRSSSLHRCSCPFLASCFLLFHWLQWITEPFFTEQIQLIHPKENWSFKLIYLFRYYWGSFLLGYWIEFYCWQPAELITVNFNPGHSRLGARNLGGTEHWYPKLELTLIIISSGIWPKHILPGNLKYWVEG